MAARLGVPALVSLISQSTGFYSNDVIAGNFTVGLFSGIYNLGGTNSEDVSVAIGQTGIVPAVAQSLRFSLSGVTSDMAVSFNAQNLPFTQIGAGSNYAIYAADISTFAGLTGELRFTEQPTSNPFSSAFLDNIQFSNLAIPEPGVFGLLAVVVGICWFRVARWGRCRSGS